MSRWQGIEEFVQVVNSGSFSAAAAILGISKSHVSQQVSRLEERLGSRLLQRTTRRLNLTEVGQQFYHQCTRIVEALDDAESSVTHLHRTVQGVLRVSSPFLLGEVHLVPAISEFLHEYPNLEIELDFTSRKVDLLEGEYDIALQVGERNDINVVNVPLTTTRFYIVASPKYIEDSDAPLNSPDDIKGHKCLLFMERGNTKPWRLRQSEEESELALKVKSHWRSNSGLALRAAVKKGLGLAYLPDYYLKSDVLDGALKVLLPEWSFNERKIVAIYSHRQFVSAKVKVFTDFLINYFQRTENKLQLDEILSN
ncbi:MAG: LysR family transcriptional regulator [Kangiellaceae bacterium]|nr:LysR family transcriptional regulator [Kangiellaceae bacterium]MCW8997205.1 LysR family transcriptional regulator [Kangiellaceae bacterium]MCW9018113.1 LysR family transcriptional regulator [Kangiellaceae bacterium]